MLQYCIRAEYHASDYEDFKVPAEDLTEARVRAEENICKRRKLPFLQTFFDWRGQVVFVNHSPSV